MLFRRTFLLGVMLFAGRAAGASGEFVLRLPDAGAVQKVRGDVRSYAEPRGLLGQEESHPSHRREPSVGAFSNAIFDVGPFVMPAQPLRINLDTLRGDTVLTQQAYVMVEVLDRNGKVDPSYSRMSMIYSAREDRYVAFVRGVRPVRWYSHFSTDGTAFTRAQADPVFKDHDAAHLLWDEARRRFVLVSLSYALLPQPRHYIDNLGWKTALGGRGIRRVIALRTSAEGVKWTPGHGVVAREPATWLKNVLLIVPNAQDPVDMEYYWFLAFRHHHRWLSIVLTYAPSPALVLERAPYDPAPSKHGPHLATEWWVSTGGIKWDRRWRETPATLDWRSYFGHDPMRLHDRMLFRTSNRLYNLPPAHGTRSGQHQEVYSLPADRIASIGSDADARFTGRPFAMPGGGMYRNEEYSGALAVELLDEQGRSLPGYARTDSALRRRGALAAPLRWGARNGSELAGRIVHLRFHTENARVYALYRD